jgi:hypothetical protein
MVIPKGYNVPEIRCEADNWDANNHRAAVANGEQHFWLVGELKYDDIFGNVTVAGFCFRYYIGTKTFHEDVGDDCNFQTTTKRGVPLLTHNRKAQDYAMQDDDEERHLHELERLQEFIIPHLDRAGRAYTQALNSLWIANAGAAVATLAFIGGTWQIAIFHHWLLVSLCFFVLGLVSMALGAIIFLVKETGIIRRMEHMSSVAQILSLRLNEIKSASEIAGLVLDCRTWAAIVSAGMFVLGIIAGVAIIAFSH